MIDRTGRSAIRANGTVLDLLPVGRVITIIGASLVLFFSIVKPEASNGLAGRTTVLGNLRDVVSDLCDSGMQVHRSHWVSHAHVRRIVGTASNAACMMSNQLRIPVSRRRWKSVREQYGRGVLHLQVSVEPAKRN